MNPRSGKGNSGKAKNFSKAMKRILKYSRKYYVLIIISLVAITGSTILTILGPDIIGKVTDLVTDGFRTQTEIIKDTPFVDLVTKLITFYVIAVFLGITQNYLMATYTQKMSKSLRSDLAAKINALPLKHFDGTSHGDTLSRVTNDVDTIGQTLNQGVAQFVGAIVMLIGTMIMMFVTNWIMAFTAIGASFIGFVFIGLIMSKSQKFFVAQQQGIGEINGYVEEIYSNQNVVKSYNASEKTIKEFAGINEQLYQSAWKSQFFSGMMMPLMGFIGNLGYVSIIVVGSILTIQDKITFGVIMSFLIYVRLFTQPLNQIAQATSNFQRTAASSERVFEFLDAVELEDESYKTEVIENPKGNVSFKNVKFGYDEDKIIINNFSADVKAGQKVAIVGPTGAGKTTMVNLLMRFYELNSGSITIDGINTQDITRENLHDQFCMVLQDTWIFGGTMIENIVYSEENITKEQVINASKKLGLDHFIRTLPEGYNTILSEKSSLSEGQKQLITIARAMIKNAPLLILDEATSSVDTRTELIIQKAMDELMKGRTSFVIAHRLSTIKNADVILVMKNGDIIESGNHNELMSQNGFYTELYNSQFQEELE